MAGTLEHMNVVVHFVCRIPSDSKDSKSKWVGLELERFVWSLKGVFQFKLQFSEFLSVMLSTVFWEVFACAKNKNTVIVYRVTENLVSVWQTKKCTWALLKCWTKKKRQIKNVCMYCTYKINLYFKEYCLSKLETLMGQVWGFISVLTGKLKIVVLSKQVFGS